jgi:hypothetical protein
LALEVASAWQLALARVSTWALPLEWALEEAASGLAPDSD